MRRVTAVLPPLICGMRHALRLHPDSVCATAARVEVEIARPSPGTLTLCYFVDGDIGGLHLPPATAAQHTDGLWRHTCFEAFLRPSPGAGYYELNFAPSTQWAAYWFSSYRTGMRAATEAGAPAIAAASSRDGYRLQASIALDRLAGLPRDVRWRLGLSAVIEEASGRKSYWALAHPPGTPDFHHDNCFAMEISPAEWS